MAPSPTTIPESVFLEIIRYALYAVAVLTTLGIGEILRRLYSIEKKQDKQNSSLMLKQDFQDWKDGDFREWKDGRDELWNEFNHHSHEGIVGSGRVVRP
jgi:hypothetical protein